MKRNVDSYVTIGLAGALIAVLGLFLWISLFFLLRIGLCCGDDSFFAMVALNLVRQGLYAYPSSSTVNHLFDPLISAGPTLILPGALALKLFGPDPRIPALTALFLSTAVFGLSFFVIARRFDLRSAMLLFIIFIPGIMLFSGAGYFFGAFLGEGPMLGFVLLGIVLLATPEARYRILILAGLCFGLAVLAKLMAGFAVLGACVTWTVYLLSRSGIAAIPKILVAAVATLILPALFEFIRWQALGDEGYVEYWRVFYSYAQYINSMGPGGFRGFLQLLADSFPWPAGAALMAPIVIGLLANARRHGARESTLLVYLLAGAVMFHCAYFVFSGASNPRYLWLAIMLVAFFLGLPVLAQRPVVQGAYVALFLILALPPMSMTQHFIDIRNWIAGNERATERQAALDYLLKRPDLPVYGQNWASSLDVMFMLPQGREWALSDDPANVGVREAIYVSLDQFAAKESPGYQRMLSSCTRQLPELKQYSVFHCGAEGARPASPAS